MTFALKFRIFVENKKEKNMKIGVIRKENATEMWSTCTMETFLEKVKKETKGKYI